MTTATHHTPYNAPVPVLFLAFELSEKSWKLGFTIGHGQKPRERTLAARDPKRVIEEVGHAKARFGLPDTARVVSCYVPPPLEVELSVKPFLRLAKY